MQQQQGQQDSLINVGISRLVDDCEYEREHGRVECGEPESPTAAMHRVAHKKFQSEAEEIARINRRHRKIANNIYLPGTHPKFPAHARQLMENLKNYQEHAEQFRQTGNIGDVSNWQAEILLSGLRALRIRIVVNPAMNLAQLRALCLQTSIEEANAYAAYGTKVESNAPVEERVDLLEKYNFIKQTRADLEAEFRRCDQLPRTLTAIKPTPTQHAYIAPGYRNMLRNVLSNDTLHRKFISMPALAARVSLEVERFLTWPENRLQRVALVSEIIAAKRAQMKQKQTKPATPTAGAR